MASAKYSGLLDAFDTHIVAKTGKRIFALLIETRETSFLKDDELIFESSLNQRCSANQLVVKATASV